MSVAKTWNKHQEEVTKVKVESVKQKWEMGLVGTWEAETQDDMDRGRMGLELQAYDLTTGTKWNPTMVFR